MKWIVVGLGLLGGCQRSNEDAASVPAQTPPPVVAAVVAEGPAVSPVTPAYAKDIEALCDVVRRSGADQLPARDRVAPIATWLAANLTTPESRAFLVRIQPLVGEAKASALEAEARRAGHAGCALAAEWR